MKLYRLTQEIYDCTRAEWTATLEANFQDVSPATYYHTLDSAETHVKKVVRDNYYVYALCESPSDPALALVDISHAVPSSPAAWLKILYIRPHPKLDIRTIPGEQVFEVIDVLGAIASSIIAGSLELSDSDLPAKTVKIFTGERVDYRLLGDALKLVPEGVLSHVGINVDRYRNWVEFNKMR